MRSLFFVACLCILGGCSSPPADVTQERHSSTDPKSAIVDPSVVHPVTPDMKKTAFLQAGATAPDFKLPDENGNPQSLDNLAKGKPALLYFIQKDCPCCVSAEPFIEQIAKAYGDRVAVIGIANTIPEEAAKWKRLNTFPAPILSDPDLMIIQSYKIATAAYSVVVSKDRKIVEVFPGYSRTMVQAMSDVLARQLGEKTGPQIDLTGAPDKPAAGCTF
ncbi:MAG: redoxin domain-containing protein [Chthonomonas sp.]|nr:redoxin domain-containing protein [Chthonomonas sp.]